MSGAATERRAGRRRAGGGRTSWLAVGGVLAGVVLVALLLQAFVRVHVVASDAMASTLTRDERVLSSSWALGPDGPSRGDVVVLGHGTTWEDAELSPAAGGGQLWTITRVVGLPGDAVVCCDAEGRITVDGEPRVEPATVDDAPFTPGVLDCATWPRSERCFPPVTVPAGRLLVLGDHRGVAPDSMVLCRGTAPASDCARFVPAERVAGRVVAKLWPPGPVG